jgi:hypothetical protein
VGSIPESLIKVGDILYHPLVDSINCGFAIEKIIVLKVFGHMNHPCGHAQIIWSFGNISFLKDQETKRDGKNKLVSAKECFFSIEECVSVLEQRRLEYMEALKTKKEDSASEIEEFKNLLKISQQESKELIRRSNKQIAMLKNFDISRDLEKRGLK